MEWERERENQDLKSDKAGLSTKFAYKKENGKHTHTHIHFHSSIEKHIEREYFVHLNKVLIFCFCFFLY